MADPLEWMNDALCAQVDTEIFFPGPGEPARDALRVCRSCTVRLDCLNHALTYPALGIWGGTTLKERQKMRGAAYRQLAS
jgi:WhiB family redox-sensing transcriptional regulator